MGPVPTVNTTPMPGRVNRLPVFIATCRVLDVSGTFDAGIKSQLKRVRRALRRPIMSSKAHIMRVGMDIDILLDITVRKRGLTFADMLTDKNDSH